MSTLLQLLQKQVNCSPLLHQFISLFLTLTVSFLIINWLFKRPSNKNLPPSPSKLPVIGHLHKLGLLPHRSLQALSRKHGPVMLLQLGSVPTLIVSSAKAAEEVMKTHDITFADRPKSKINQKLLYDYKDISVAPYGDYWRQIKSVCVLQLLSNARVQANRKLREKETALLMKKIVESSSSVVDLSDLFMTLTSDIVSLSAFGRKYSEGESGRKFKKMMKEFVSVLGVFDVGTYIPILEWISTLSGLYVRVDRIQKELDEFLEGLVEEHLQKSSDKVEGTEDFVDLLLGIYKDKSNADFCMDRDSIKAILMDIAAGGTDTTYTVLEWAMTELLKDPKAMKEVQSELRKIANGKKSYIFEQGDFEKMNYLKAVIKETLRLHPPIPLIIPRSAREDVKFMGYDIAAGTMVITNAFAIGRDPASWDEPDEFRPERFLNTSVDFRGHDFQLLPFGAGRRGCPGISFAMATNELVLANLLHKFEWNLPDGMKAEDLDMNECTGLTIHRKVPLLAVATPYNS